MRRKIRGLATALLTIVTVVSLTGGVAAAANVFNNTDNTGPCSGANGTQPSFCTDTKVSGNPLTGPDGIMTKVIQVLALVVGITAVITLIVSGIRLAASGGNEQSVKTARSGVLYALIGVAVAVAAQAIVTFVIGKV